MKKVLSLLLAGLLFSTAACRSGAASVPTEPAAAGSTVSVRASQTEPSSAAATPPANSAAAALSPAASESAGSSASADAAAGGTVQPEEICFTDDLGREVRVPAQAARTAALIGSFADVWTLAGGRVIATANDAWTQFDLGLDGSVVNLGKTTAISLEQLLAAEPDFIIASSKTRIDMDLLPTFEQMGIPTAYFNVSTFDEYLHMLDICCRITGRRDLYEQNGLAVKAQIERVLAQAKNENKAPEVLYLRASAASVKVKGSKGTVLGAMLKDLGCRNIADKDGALLENLSIERIVEDDPEYIFLVMQGSDQAAVEKRLRAELTGNPAWNSLTAVREGRLYFMDQKLYNLKPNDRWGEAYEGLARILFAKTSP